MTSPPDSIPAGLDPQTLERLRRGVPLRLTALGVFMFGDDPVTHARVDKALHGGLDVTDEGEPIVRLGAQWCYLEIDDCPLRVTAIRESEGELTASLDDGRTLPLDPRTLWEEAERGLRCRFPSIATGRPLDARLTNTAQMDLSPWLEFVSDRPVLTLSNPPLPIPTSDPGPPSAQSANP